MSDVTVKEGIRLYKAGKKDQAREIWEQVTENEPYNEQAWLWLSAVVESADDQRTCLENVLYINPDNANARKGLETLEAKEAKAAPPPAPEPFVPAAPPPPQERFSAPPTATSSASSTFTPEEPEPEIYDNWISNLNLSGSSTQSAPADSGLFDDDAFSDEVADNFQFDSVFDDDDLDLDASDDYNNVNDMRSFIVDDTDFDDDPFADDPFADQDLTSGPFSANAYTLDDDEIDFAAAPPPQPTRKESGVAAPKQAKSQTPKPTQKPAPQDDIIDEDADPSVYFDKIPQSIKPTRFPGTDAPQPTLPRIIAGLLFIANLGAAGFLIFRLIG